VVKRVSLKGKGADLFFGAVASTPTVGEASPAQPQADDSSGSTPTDQAQRISPTGRRVEKATSGQVVKYTTHLRPETIKAVKRIAFESERKDYEIVQEAIDAYLRRLSRS
jgi:hypothetical protein